MGNWRKLVSEAKHHGDAHRFDDALRCLKEALTLQRGDAVGTAITLNYIGDLHKQRPQLEEALRSYEQALETDDPRVRKIFTAMRLNALGVAFKNIGDYRKALDCYDKAFPALDTGHGSKGRAIVLNNRGIVYRNIGQYKRAEELHRQAYDLLVKESPDETLYALIGLGMVHAHQGKWEEAEAEFGQAVGIQERTGSGDVDEVTMRAIANCYLNCGRLEEAEPYVERSGHDALRGRLLLAKARALKTNGPDPATLLEQSVQAYQSLLDSVRAAGHAFDVFAGYAGLGQAYEEMDRPEPAEEYYRKALAFNERMRVQTPSDHKERFFDVAFEGFSRLVPYEGLARVLWRTGRWNEAFEISELSKARTFADALHNLADLGDDALPLEFLTHPRPLALAEMALRPDEWVLAYNVTETGLLIYLLHGREVKKCLFENVDRHELRELVKKFRRPFDEISSKNSVHQLAAFDFDLGRRLSNILLTRVISDIPQGCHVTIIPDEFLGYLPFEMLVLEGGPARLEMNASGFPCAVAHFFSDRNPLSYYQSVGALTLTRTSSPIPQPSAARILAIAPFWDRRASPSSVPERSSPDEFFDRNLLQSDRVAQRSPDSQTSWMDVLMHGANWSPLPRTAELVQNLLAACGQDVTLLAGDRATKEALKQVATQPTSAFATVLFATHGYYRSDGTEPFLVLRPSGSPGDNGCLLMSEVTSSFRINTDVVILLACQSGLGEHLAGEGVMGMGRAFQYAGARSVLMSLWSVDEEPSVGLVREFLRSRRQGRSKIDALQRAREHIRKAGYDHPFFWAGFVLAGEVD